MPDTTTSPNHIVFTPTADDMDAIHYGVAIAELGEDSDMVIALGHAEPRRALAAFNWWARVNLKLINLVDDERALASDVLRDIEHQWGLFTRPTDDDECSWYVDYEGTSADTPGAVPVTVWRA